MHALRAFYLKSHVNHGNALFAKFFVMLWYSECPNIPLKKQDFRDEVGKNIETL